MPLGCREIGPLGGSISGSDGSKCGISGSNGCMVVLVVVLLVVLVLVSVVVLVAVIIVVGN